MNSAISEHLANSARVKAQLADDPVFNQQVVDAVTCCVSALQHGKKILTAGNGGSAADAQHLAAELVCRFEKTRQALPAIALTTDTSILTAVSNDLGYENLFARQIAALGQEGDVALLISTSGSSANILRAAHEAKAAGMKTVGFCGLQGQLNALVDHAIEIPATNTALIQECHISVGHVMCRLIEQAFTPASNE